MDPTTDTDLITEIVAGATTLLQLGGPVVGILLAASVLGLALALVKFLQFSGAGAAPIRRLNVAIDHWQNGDRDKAVNILDRSRLGLAVE